MGVSAALRRKLSDSDESRAGLPPRTGWSSKTALERRVQAFSHLNRVAASAPEGNGRSASRNVRLHHTGAVASSEWPRVRIRPPCLSKTRCRLQDGRRRWTAKKSRGNSSVQQRATPTPSQSSCLASSRSCPFRASCSLSRTTSDRRRVSRICLPYSSHDKLLALHSNRSLCGEPLKPQLQ
jgi:hypothetical protein